MSFSLSGPVFAALGKYKGKTYYLFGDNHANTLGTCPPPCNSIEDNCLDIMTYIDFLILRDPSIFVDVYIESPFLSFRTSSQYQPTDTSSFLGLVRTNFYSCLSHHITPNQCPYDNARFHYVDIRQQILHETQTSASIFLFLDKNILKEESYRPDASPLRGTHRQMIRNDFIFWLFDPKFNRAIKLFKLYLTSDNFIFDVKRLIGNYEFDYLKFGERVFNILFNPANIVYRRDKVMHRIRAQLEFLEYQNNDLLAKSIELFIYRHAVDHWEKFRIKIFKQRTPTRVKEVIHQRFRRLTQEFDVLLMDAYTLGRIFRIRQPESDVVIVYAGLHHIENYLTFFRDFLGSTSFETYKTNTDLVRCLQFHK